MLKAVESLVTGCLGAGFLMLASIHGAGAFDAVAGGRLAQEWCSGCHLVDGVGSSDVVPGFRQIANDPSKTRDRLRAWLSSPHPMMPDFNLSRPEIDNIIAYLESLRNE